MDKAADRVRMMVAMETCPLDDAIQKMPLLVQENILREWIAAKLCEKRSLEWSIVHHDLFGWGAVKRELKAVFKRRLESLEAAWEDAFERAFDAWQDEEWERQCLD